MTSQILQFVDFTNHRNLNISRTKHYFFFKYKNSLITHQGLLYGKKYFRSRGNLDGIVKNKKRLFSSHIESPIFNTNPNNIKLQMLVANTKRVSNKQSQSWQWVKWSRHPR